MLFVNHGKVKCLFVIFYYIQLPSMLHLNRNSDISLVCIYFRLGFNKSVIVRVFLIDQKESIVSM